MGPLSCMRSVVNRNVVMRRMSVIHSEPVQPSSEVMPQTVTLKLRCLKTI